MTGGALGISPARDLMRAARDCVRTVEAMHRRLRDMRAAMQSTRAPDGMPRGSGASDPMGAVQAYVDAEADCERRISALEDVIGDALVVIEGIRAACGTMAGDAVEMWVIDGWGMGRIGDAMGAGETTARRVIDAALDECDRRGLQSMRALGRAGFENFPL